MSPKRKKQVNTVIFLVLAVAVSGCAVPGVRLFRAWIFGGANGLEALAGSILAYGMTAIVILAAVSGLLAIFKASVTGPSVLIALVMMGCGAALYTGVKNTAETVEPSPAPRPTITPPVVEIQQSGSISEVNPETGTEFFRLYSTSDTKLVIENGSNSDVFMQMLDRYDKVVLQFYIRMGDTLNIKVPWGTYHFQMATGRYWEGLDTLFGTKTHYRALPETYSLQREATEQMSFSTGFPETETIREREFVR